MAGPSPGKGEQEDEIIPLSAAAARNGINKSDAPKMIQQRALERIPEMERARFAEVVENELLNLHIGNIARYRIRPSEFEEWQKKWPA